MALYKLLCQCAAVIKVVNEWHPTRLPAAIVILQRAASNGGRLRCVLRTGIAALVAGVDAEVTHTAAHLGVAPLGAGLAHALAIAHGLERHALVRHALALHARLHALALHALDLHALHALTLHAGLRSNTQLH